MLDKDNRLPLYYQLMDTIVEQIENGTLAENDKLPSERELCDLYDVSRTTVRQTMQGLEQNGYIYKKHGKGSYVSSKVFNQSLVNFYSFTEEMRKIGKKPTTHVVDFAIIPCDSKIAKKMSINIDEQVYKITRLRLSDGEPMIYETSYLPAKRFKNLSLKMLEEAPMYDVFSNQFQVNITNALEKFKAVTTSKETAQLLQIDTGAPCLKIDRITYEQSMIIEYTISFARGDKFSYSVELSSGNK